MIDYSRTYETGTIECDICGYQEEYDGEFTDVVAQAKENGWQILKEFETWVHHCTDCRLDRPENIFTNLEEA